MMIATLPLKKMSVQDKISAMESIWDDLCRNAGDVTSPEWHKDVLNKREENLKSGADSFIDWEDAKKKIRKKIQ
jgi:putative addiction module component (TIGR02574 family)